MSQFTRSPPGSTWRLARATSIPIQLVEEHAVIAHDAERVGRGGALGKAIALVILLAQEGKQLAVRGIVVEIVNVHGLADLVLDQVEIAGDRAIDDFTGVGIPADDDTVVIRGLHDLLHHPQVRRFGAVHFDADFLTVSGGVFAAFAQRLADAVDRFAAVFSFGDSIRTDLHTR